jgi:hypothetical protein
MNPIDTMKRVMGTRKRTLNLSFEQRESHEKAIALSNEIRDLKASPGWKTILKVTDVQDKRLDEENLENIRKGVIDADKMSQNTMARVAMQDFIKLFDALENQGKISEQMINDCDSPVNKGGKPNA